MPEVVARLLGTVRQLRRGLETLVPLGPQSSARSLLVEIEDVLRVALEATRRQAADEAPSPEEVAALGSLPARLARAEDAAVDIGSVAAVVYADPPSHRALVSATGAIEPVLMVVHQPAKEEPILAVGAHVAHHELVATRDLTDTAWRAAAAPARPAWVGAFRWVRPVAPVAPAAPVAPVAPAPESR
jgi:hypothetical protein